MTGAERDRQPVVFSLHGEYYGLPITSVSEIIRYVPPSATATASGEIKGMINLRGRTLPIVDLSSRMGGQLETGRRTRILVVEVSNGSLGLIADTVDGIIEVRGEQVESPPDHRRHGPWRRGRGGRRPPDRGDRRRTRSVAPSEAPDAPAHELGPAARVFEPASQGLRNVTRDGLHN
jgi:chemotaxis signal transduction protein